MFFPAARFLRFAGLTSDVNPMKPATICTVILLASVQLALAPTAMADYNPDRPLLCVDENETTTKHNGTESGSYSCDTGVFGGCTDLKGGEPCRYCSSYRYSGNATDEDSDYQGCISTTVA